MAPATRDGAAAGDIARRALGERHHASMIGQRAGAGAGPLGPGAERRGCEHLGHRHHGPAAAWPASDLHHQVERRAQLLAHRLQRQADLGQEHHRLETTQRVVGPVGMAGGQRSLVPGVHGLQQSKRLASAGLADEEAVGPHAQGVAHQLRGW